MKQIISIVGKKTGSNNDAINLAHSIGGIYMKLENELKDQLKIKNTLIKGKYK